MATGRDRPGDPLVRFAALLHEALTRSQQTPVTLGTTLDALAHCATEVVDWVAAASRRDTAAGKSDDHDEKAQAEAQRWAQALLAQCRAAIAELRFLAPGATRQGGKFLRCWNAAPRCVSWPTAPVP